MGMRRDSCLLFACIVLICLPASTLCQTNQSSPRSLTREEIQTLIQETEHSAKSTLEREVYLPGLAIAIVGRDEILMAEAFGYRDAGRKGRMDANTLLGLLSISKTVTVTGLMKAVEEGLIDLDTPIGKYLPGFHLRTRFPEDPMSTITIRHLLSMTSGLTHDAPVGNNADPACPSYSSHIQSISRTWLRFRTGERAEYSNLGVELAAHILETVTHRPFTEYIQTKVFDPLEMSRSTYDYARIRRDENRALGHNKNFDRVPLDNPMLAPGGIYTSISDMARFLKFQLNDGRVNGNSVVSPEVLSQMRKIPFPIKDQLGGYGMGLWSGYYHLGGEEVRWLAHGGGGFGFRCQMKWLPELGYGAIVMTNSQDHDNVNEDLVEEILLKIIRNLTGKKDLGPADWLAHHMPARTVDSSFVPADLAGRYNGTNDDMVFLVKDGRFGLASGNTFVPMTPVTRNECVSKRYLYRFVCDASGRPVSLVRPYDGLVWLLGKSDAELKGPDKRTWAKFTGSYIRKRFGKAERHYSITVKNGWLHFEGDGQDFRLTEHVPGLFFTPDGEAIDCRTASTTFRNIRLYKAGS
jgi:CubicO group peptidase (beta-lactamase class C family)